MNTLIEHSYIWQQLFVVDKQYDEIDKINHDVLHSIMN